MLRGEHSQYKLFKHLVEARGAVVCLKDFKRWSILTASLQTPCGRKRGVVVCWVCRLYPVLREADN